MVLLRLLPVGVVVEINFIVVVFAVSAAVVVAVVIVVFVVDAVAVIVGDDVVVMRYRWRCSYCFVVVMVLSWVDGCW